MPNKKLKNIIVLGGGTAGWVTGAILSKDMVKHGYSLTVVDTAEIPTIGVGEASIPTIYDLLSYLDIPDSDLIKHCAATFKYGIEFENWSKPGEKYMHGFGNMGHNFVEEEFFKVWSSSAHYFSNHDLGPFVPTAVAAYADKFSRGAKPPTQNTHLFYPLSEISYALHFDASLLAKRLRVKALENGATHLSKHIVDVKCDEHGISALLTADGQELTADLYIDCSGMSGALLQKALKVEFENWEEFLPCNKAIALQTKRDTPAKLYTRSVAHKAGWRWEIQLQNRTGNGIVYSDAFMSDEEALAYLMKEIKGEAITTPRTISFKTGRVNTPWLKNTVAIGLSAGFLEPLESTSIHLICAYAQRIQKAINKDTLDDQEKQNFNKAWVKETNEIRDFLMMHYLVNQRHSDPFWNARREGKKPESLKIALNQLKHEGWLSLSESALFGHDSWFEVAVGQKLDIQYEKLATHPEQAKKNIEFLTNVRNAIKSEISSISLSHREILKSLFSQ